MISHPQSSPGCSTWRPVRAGPRWQPHWSVCIALEHKGKIVSGVVFDPAKDELFWAEKGEGAWLNDLLTWGSFGVMLLLSVFRMLPGASAITAMFLEDVAQAVEDRHYPHLPPATMVPFGDAVRDTINFLGLLIGANVLALLLYVFFPPFSPFIFWGMNGYLLGREYFTLAAMRRGGREGARTMLRQNVGRVWIAGILMAMPLSVPLVNLLIPILGAATFTHLFHQIQSRAPSG